MGKWISLEEQQPGNYQPILLLNPESREVFTSAWCRSELHKKFIMDLGYTHWIDAPEFPSEDP